MYVYYTSGVYISEKLLVSHNDLEGPFRDLFGEVRV